MSQTSEEIRRLPEDLKRCIEFHGHFCPGLTYGYIVAKEAIRRLDLDRSSDEEVVAVCESDSCAVDAIQVLLGTTMGKGNLTINNYGKNVYTILSRDKGTALRFSRKSTHSYTEGLGEEFRRLEAAVSAGTATEAEKMRQKLLKAKALLAQPFDEIFRTEEVGFIMPAYAPLAPSKACDECGEMTMATKLVEQSGGRMVCIPCAAESSP